MAAPVITTTTSVLDYKQWEYFEYQPYATNTPTSWACPNLPDGLSINTSTGKISGAATVQGVYNVGLTATNGDGTSAALIIPIGIRAAEAGLTRPGVELTYDIQTNKVAIVGGTAESTLFGRVGDTLLMWIRFVKQDTTLDLDVASLGFGLKERDIENTVALGDEWDKFGTGTGTSYGLFVPLEAEKLDGVLSNYESARGKKRFVGFGEIEVVLTSAYEFGPSTIRFTSEDIPLTIAADKVEITPS